jgi:SulP family sulfate permease
MFRLIIKKPVNVKNDVLSGITVALALVPEAIAFSFVAHVPPTVGLYAAFMMGIITAIFGGRPGMISGATGAVAVIFAPLVIQQTQLHGMSVALSYLFLAVTIMGLIQVIFGFAKWGKFVRLIPHPVMLGFVNGLAIIIFKAQFSQFTIHGEWLPFPALITMIGLVLLTMAIIQFLPRFSTALPATLVAIGVVSGVSVVAKKMGATVYTVLDFVQQIDPAATTIRASLPSFQFPMVSLDAIFLVLPYACLAAAVGLIESLMTLTLIDELTETRGRGNKESMAQGLANIVNGFFGGMGGCAMIGQSMINIRAGGRTRLSGVSAALGLLFFVGIGSGLIEAIPLAALVGVMVMVSIATFEWASIRMIHRIPKSDAWVIVVVSSVTVVIDLAVAVLVGVVVSALVFAWEQGKIIIFNSSIEPDGSKRYTLKGNLFFGSVQSFKNGFDISQDPSTVVLDFANARVHDYSGIEAIQRVAERYAAQNKAFHLVNVSRDCEALLKKSTAIKNISLTTERQWAIAANELA